MSAVSMLDRPKNETGSERGAGEGAVSGRALRAAISVYGTLDWKPVERRSGSRGGIKTANRVLWGSVGAVEG